MERLMRYVLSNSNLAGCGAASLVILLFLTGVIGNYWMILTALAYAAGYFSMLQPAPAHLLEGASTQESLQWLRTKALPKLPGEAGKLLGHIIDICEELMPRLKEMEGQGMVQAQNRALLKQTVCRYLPDVVEGYLKLPTLYARTARVAEGKTPNQLLLEQLSTLDTHVQEIRDGVLSEEVNSLLANGKFLQEKFNKSFSFTH